VLTTQLYFPGEERCASKRLVVRAARRDGTLNAEFDFVLER